VLDPVEALLLDAAAEGAVHEQRRAGVAVERVDTEDGCRHGTVLSCAAPGAGSGAERAPSSTARSSSSFTSTRTRYQNPGRKWKTKPCLPSRKPGRRT